MNFISRENIDIEKYEKTIDGSDVENVFCRSFYLDSVADNWGILASEDYSTVVPIPYTKKLGVKQLYQPPFSRELDIYGSDFKWSDVVEQLAADFKAIQFRNSEAGLFENETSRVHQILELNDDYPSGFSTNAKRLIKKADKIYTVESSSDIETMSDLFKKHVFSKIDSISDGDLSKLDKLMTSAISENRGQLLVAKEEDRIVGAAYFLKDKKRVTYLKGASDDASKKNGVMFLLISKAMEKFAADYDRFDFGGSDIENIATFYKKFGAVDRTYYNYTIDNLPIWFKTLKRIKG